MILIGNSFRVFINFKLIYLTDSIIGYLHKSVTTDLLYKTSVYIMQTWAI